MSVKIMGAIWDLDLPHELAWVLMAYADHADHDGRNCYPGTKLIAYKTSYSERTVQRCTAALVARGILTVERSGKRGMATVYRISLSAAPMKSSEVSESKKQKGDKMSPYSKPADELAERVTPAPDRTTSETEMVTENAIGVTETPQKGDIAMAPQPLTVIEPSLEPSGTARVREPDQFLAFSQVAHRNLQRLTNRSDLRAPVWRLDPDGRLDCGIWEPAVYQAAQREPLKFSVIGQDAIKHLGRRVAIRFLPAWEDKPCSSSPPGSSALSSPEASYTSSLPGSAPA